MSIDEWVLKGLHSFKPSREFTIRALRHLSDKKKEDLFAQSGWLKRVAIGELYEAIIYEKLLQLTSIDNDYAVVGKWDDVPWRSRVRPCLGQDGLYYDRSGAIVARGNGQDLSEFDLLLTNLHNEYAFLEIKNSPRFLKEFDLKLEYKRRLLSYLFSKPVQCGVVVSSLKISKKPVIKRITATPGNFLVVTDAMDEMDSSIKPEDLSRRFYHRDVGFRPMPLSEIVKKGFNYRSLHDAYREELIKAVMKGKKPNLKGNFWMIKNVIVGYLDESAIKNLFSEKNIVVQGERLTPETFFQHFSRVVLSIRLPELRPVLYLRLHPKRAYWKMGPSTTTTFEYERHIYAKRTAFFDWLESAEFRIRPDLTKQIMRNCLNASVTGKRKKVGELEKFS